MPFSRTEITHCVTSLKSSPKKSCKREYGKNVMWKETDNYFKYTFLDPKSAEKETQVCQRMVLNTLSISKKQSKYQNSFLKRTTSGTVKQDEKMRHNKYIRVSKLSKVE